MQFYGGGGGDGGDDKTRFYGGGSGGRRNDAVDVDVDVGEFKSSPPTPLSISWQRGEKQVHRSLRKSIRQRHLLQL